MGTVSTLPAFLDELRDALSARQGLVGVTIWTGSMPPERLGRESVVLAATGDKITAEYNYRIGTQRVLTDEEYDVLARVETRSDDAGETGAQAVRDRAFAILGEIHDYLAANDTVGATVADARITGWEYEAGPYAEGGRICRVAITIRVESQFTPA